MNSKNSCMIYIVATHSFLVTVEFDMSWQVHNYTILDTEHHYGITLADDSRVLSVKRRGNKLDDRQLTTYQIGRSCNLVGVSSIPLVGDMGDIHQIAYANDGICIMNTMYNSLVLQSRDGNVRHEHSFGNVSYDLNHPNSVYPCGEQIFVLLHNRGHGDSEVAVLHHDLSRGFVLRKLVSLWHKGGHNVLVDENRLYYNASGVGEFVIVDLTKERVIKKLPFSGHTKGLSATQDHFVIGVSEDAPRDKRFTSRGYLGIIDRHSLSVVSIVDVNFRSLPHPIGNINEVRCLSEKELAQSGPRLLNVDWSSLRLSQGDLLHRARTKLSTPATRRVKQFVTRFASRV